MSGLLDLFVSWLVVFIAAGLGWPLGRTLERHLTRFCNRRITDTFQRKD